MVSRWFLAEISDFREFSSIGFYSFQAKTLSIAEKHLHSVIRFMLRNTKEAMRYIRWHPPLLLVMAFNQNILPFQKVRFSICPSDNDFKSGFVGFTRSSPLFYTIPPSWLMVKKARLREWGERTWEFPAALTDRDHKIYKILVFPTSGQLVGKVRPGKALNKRGSCLGEFLSPGDGRVCQVPGGQANHSPYEIIFLLTLKLSL